MQKPNESLDDFVVKPEPEIPAEPPLPVLLRSTGEVEVLKPLARWERPVKLVPIPVETDLRPATYRFSWFHRSLAAAGAFSVVALVLASAVVIGIYDPPSSPDAAQIENVSDQRHPAADRRSDERAMPTEDPLSSDIFSSSSRAAEAEDPISASDLRLPRSYVRKQARNVSRRKAIPSLQPQPAVMQFSPTTLVIYIDNGEIKTRIEPWLYAGLKRPLTLSN